MIPSKPEWTNTSDSGPRKEDILITIKAYPNPSVQYIETVCVAGVTKDSKWIRLYPIPYRDLQYEQKFPTYSWIEATVRKSSKDYRPESHKVDADTIVVKGHVDTKDAWQVRKSILFPLVRPSIEYLRDQFERDYTSLGLIRPKEIRRLLIKKEKPDWEANELATLRKRTLFDRPNIGSASDVDGTYEAVQELEKIPFRFQYEFVCEDIRCKGHTYSIISWEVLQSYRKWQHDYGDEWEKAFRQKYESELLNKQHDLHFFVGTMFNHPNQWGINGLFYPPASEVTQNSLF